MPRKCTDKALKAGETRESSGRCFQKGKTVGFALGKNRYSQAELQGAPRVFSEAVANLKGMRATQARNSSKATLITYILANQNVRQSNAP